MSTLTRKEVRTLKSFYLLAAAAICAGDGELIRDSNNPDHYEYRYSEDKLQFIDKYIVKGQYIEGKINIYDLTVGTEPLWEMHYCGYTKDGDAIIAFLKRVLSYSYKGTDFYGGRGKSGLSEKIGGKTLLYRNATMDPRDKTVVMEGLFPRFVGFEQIIGDETGEVLHQLNYSGGLILDSDYTAKRLADKKRKNALILLLSVISFLSLFLFWREVKPWNIIALLVSFGCLVSAYKVSSSLDNMLHHLE